MVALRKALEPLEVHIVSMRRRHLRSVLRIEQQVYPKPWSHSLFVSELALRSTRAYSGCVANSAMSSAGDWRASCH